MLGEDCLFVFPLTLFSYLFPCLPFGLHIEFMRGLILCGVIYGRTVQTTPTPCTGQTTARLKGSSVHQLPPTVLSKFSPTAPAHTASLEPWYVHCNQEDNHYVKGKDIHWNFILLMHFSFLWRFWKGLYNRFDHGMHPRQSVEDYLRAIQEETQQLEEQLSSHTQVGQGYADLPQA